MVTRSQPRCCYIFSGRGFNTYGKMQINILKSKQPNAGESSSKGYSQRPVINRWPFGLWGGRYGSEPMKAIQVNK
jgi:hypothetical protein